MPSSFVMAFGGTGARCVEALLYLQASGWTKRPIQVLLVDPDTANGNTATTQTQLVRYHSLQQRVRAIGEPPAFFSYPVNPDDADSSVSWDYPTPPQPFGSTLDFAARDEGTRALLELLYDETDLDLSFEHGFVGRAHIGSLDVLRVLRDELAQAQINHDAPGGQTNALVRFFQRIRSAAQGDGARVVVVGSLFGGTGASALPAIPPLIREAFGDVAGGIDMASLQLAPYFSFDPGGENDPDSALHPLATQAALYHYAGAPDYDSIYFVGAPERPRTSNGNQRGGPNQRNTAHYAEIAAALGARDFFERPAGHYGKAVAAGSDEATWSGLPAGRPVELRKALTAFTTATYFHAVFMYDALRNNHHRHHRWERSINQAGDRLGGGEEELELLKHFADRYLTWVAEVSRSTDKPLFDLAGPRDAVRLGGIGQNGRAGSDAYHDLFETLNRVSPTSQNTPVGHYMDMLTKASYRFCARNYAGWWGEESER